MSEDNDRADGLLDKMMGDMPRWVKSVVYVFMVPTLVLTASAIMLQVNAGKLIEEYIDRKYDLATASQVTEAGEQTVAAIDTSLALLLEQITVRLDDNALGIVDLRDRVFLLENTPPADIPLDAFDDRFSKIETRLDALAGNGTNTRVMRTEKEILTLRKWVCQHSAVQSLKTDAPAFCSDGGR